MPISLREKNEGFFRKLFSRAVKRWKIKAALAAGAPNYWLSHTLPSIDIRDSEEET